MISQQHQTEYAELLSRAEALIPLLQKNAEQTERDRRVAEENIQAIADAGLFRLTIPRRLGGYEAPYRVWLEIEAALARGCASTAWAFSLMNIGNWFGGLYSEEAQREIFTSDRIQRVCGVFTPSGESRKVDGGWIVSGRWPYASGSWHSGWGMVGFPLADESGQIIDVAFGMAPIEDGGLSIDDTWFVSGMAGTGSNTLVADEVFFPEHRLMRLSLAAQGQLPTPFDEPLYQVPFMSIGCLILAGPQLGIARAALDYVVEKAPNRMVTYHDYASQAEAPTVQLAVGKASSALGLAELAIYGLCDELYANAVAHTPPEVFERTRIRAVNAHAIALVRESIRELASAHGAGSFALSNPLQRMLRDSETASRHSFALYETAIDVHGKALLGIDLPTSML